MAPLRFNLVQCKRCGEWYATTEMLDWAKVPVEEKEKFVIDAENTKKDKNS